ncbi:MAG: amidohydrolase family protein [Deltaproteobacteria bacterium]|nr:amidohydrolase family protein [Deltaproteobacteria bacterium]
MLDCHTHIFPPEIAARREEYFGGEPDFQLLYADPKSSLAGAEELVEYLRSDGLDAACAFGFPWRSAALAQLCNEYVLDAARRFPGAIVPFGCVHPLGGTAALREAERCLSLGARGLGELATYGEGLGESVRRSLAPLAELCREAGVPLLLHTNEPVGHAYPGKSRMEPSEIYALVRAHPQTPWILAHWGGGLFAYELMKKEVREVLRNAYFDTAAGPYLYEPAIYRSFLEIAGRDRLLFGSDFPLLRLPRYARDLDAAGVREEERAAVLGGNLARLLGLRGAA